MIISSPNKHLHLIPSNKVLDGFIGITTKINEPFFNEFNNNSLLFLNKVYFAINTSIKEKSR